MSQADGIRISEGPNVHTARHRVSKIPMVIRAVLQLLDDDFAPVPWPTSRSR